MLATVFAVPAVRERLRQVRRQLLMQPLYEPADFDLLQLEVDGLVEPTTLEFGPDGRLYVAETGGQIKVLDVERGEDGVFRVIRNEVISAVYETINHDDHGKPVPQVVGRLITGMAVAGTADSPLIYVASSDPRLFSRDVDTNSGIISRLDRVGGLWVRTDLVRGLPRSRGDHAPHGIALDAPRGKLLLSQGGNTNAGARSSDFLDLPEYALTAAILEIDLNAIVDPPYDLPTLDDDDRPGSPDENDPFGGNGGKNQAVESPDGPVRIHATGIRNSYDVLLTSRGLYVIDNGANQGWGGPPKIHASSGRIEHVSVEGGRKSRNQLHQVREGGYYGHPNPVRADATLRFNKTIPQSPIREARPHEASRRYRRIEGRRLCVFPGSTNGITEYWGGLDHPPRDGALLAASFDQAVYALDLDATGSRVLEKRVLARELGFGPLDVVARGRDQSFPGTIWLSDHSGSRIWILDPQRLRPWTLGQAVRDAREWFWMTIAKKAAFRARPPRSGK
jgi:hypothetical protein